MAINEIIKLKQGRKRRRERERYPNKKKDEVNSRLNGRKKLNRILVAKLRRQ
jgi:hypothetical protein